ncbi:MAG: hypothetical protein ACI351_05760 [Candidatus Avelusimicrobium sp.]|uniref:hypothetical protein n=1 Tax=Candidatus Avelusimicrobium sp. TaxID=3048833 RepID=UPI003F038952
MKFLFPFLRRYKDCLLFAALVIGYGVWGIMRGQVSTWDLMNYHLYNAYAFINGRFGTDIMPAGVHTFLNPLSDVPYYLMIRYLNDYPRVIAFIMSCWSGVLLFLFYKFCALVYGRKEWLWTCFAAVFAAGGYIFVTQTGSQNNDIFLNASALCGIYLFFRFLFRHTRKRSYLFWASFIVCGVTGLKYTLACVPIAMFAVLCANYRHLKDVREDFGAFVLGGLTGFLVTNGYFVWRLWEQYDNPVFPFYNNIFKSTYFEPEHLKDIRFYPQTVVQWLFFPFLRFLKPEGIISEMVKDYRMAAGFVSYFIVLAVWLKGLGKRTGLEWRRMGSLLLFIGVLYGVWLKTFAILRYVIILEMFSCLLVVYVIKLLPVRKWISICLAVLGFTFLMQTVAKEDWGERRFAFAGKVIDIKPALPKVEPNALVIFWGSPMSFLAPFFPQDAVFIGGIRYPSYNNHFFTIRQQARLLNFLPEIYFKHHFDETIRECIRKHSGPIYIVSVPWEMMLDPQTLAPYGLEKTGERCQVFNSNLNIYLFRGAGWTVCRVRKTSAAVMAGGN